MIGQYHNYCSLDCSPYCYGYTYNDDYYNVCISSNTTTTTILCTDNYYDVYHDTDNCIAIINIDYGTSIITIICTDNNTTTTRNDNTNK